MSSQEAATGKVPMVRPTKHPMGTDTTLLDLESGPTELYMLTGDWFGASQAFRSGRFAVHFMRLSRSPVSMATCSVENHQWMLARDSLTLRVGLWMFVFALPGFLYGLALPDGCSEYECNMLEGILMRFCNYRDLREEEGNDSRLETNVWATVHSKVIKLTAQSSRIKSELPVEISGKKRWHDAITMKVLRAVRTSAALKLVSGALLAGALDSTRHLNTANFGREDGSTGQCLFPTMSTIAGLLLAIESGSKGSRLLAVAPSIVDGYWCLNQQGLALLTKAVLATSNAPPAKRPWLDTIQEDGEETETVLSSSGGGGVAGGRAKEVKRERAVY